ncbi:hypothetical protein CPC08DRAFT_356471 [Agrocybe pediades]|nr:hypothetical protein CPC08DRAFT_356471 [Agrocybe pediades]
MSASNITRVPTVNDLRVKLCYICREEELAGAPQEGPARAWTHPCNCTLIAHEQCLLKWIQTSQGNASRAPNALKCPQCGVQYEMESDNPILLRALSIGNKVLQRLGRYFTVFAATAAVGVIGTSIYVCLTAYGAYAIQKFLGKEFFDLAITDDPANWSWSIHSIIIPLLLVWPVTSPVGEGRRRLIEFWSQPENSRRLPSLLQQTRSSWPPSPWVFGVVALPFVRVLYNRAYAKAYLKLMGTPLPAPRRMPRGGIRFNEGPFVIRIRANVVDENGNEVPEQQQQQDANAAPAAPAPAEGEGEGAAAAGAGENQNPNAAVVEAAEQLIDINASSLGRKVGGALIMPAISSTMGNLLFKLSRYSSLLRSFLGIRARVSGSRYPLPSWDLLPIVRSGILQKGPEPWRVLLNTFWGGSPMWVDSDPVWWRNAVGFGLFIVIKDCAQLLHLWLAKRELESRRVKDKDFRGVDIRELDLLPSFFRSS